MCCWTLFQIFRVEGQVLRCFKISIKKKIRAGWQVKGHSTKWIKLTPLHSSSGMVASRLRHIVPPTRKTLLVKWFSCMTPKSCGHDHISSGSWIPRKQKKMWTRMDQVYICWNMLKQGISWCPPSICLSATGDPPWTQDQTLAVTLRSSQGQEITICLEVSWCSWHLMMFWLYAMNQHDPASALKVEDVRINKQPVQNEHGLAVQCILGRTWKCTMLTHFNCARGYAADWRKIALAEKKTPASWWLM